MATREEPRSNFEWSGASLTPLVLLLLSISQVVLFSGSFRYFFQGDSLYWLAERLGSAGELFASFTQVDSYGYFRPLSHRLFPSLLYPLFDLRPTGYHAVTLAIFLATTWLAHAFFRRLSGSHAQAFFGAFFFGVHSTNVFVTFDAAFAPELLYGLFYLLSAFHFVGERRDGSRPRVGLSLVFFGLSLLSKEAAVTLPANLFLLAWFLRTGARPLRRFAESLKAVGLHLVLLTVYLGYLFGAVRGGGPLLGSAGAGTGALEKAASAVANLKLAILWGFNLPGGWHAAWRSVPPALEAFLALLALATLIGLIDALIRPKPGKALIPLGFLWFLVALIPMLALTEFKPYYLYVPLLGLSMAVGKLAQTLRERVPRRFGSWGDFGLVLSLAMLWQSCHLIAAQDLARHPLLGPAAESARQAAREVEMLRPNPPQGTSVLILDDGSQPLWWRYASGRLFQLVYGDPSLRVFFASLGQRPDRSALERDGFLAVRVENGSLIDVTEAFRRDPGAYFPTDFSFSESVSELIRITPSEVVAGEGRYMIQIPGWADREVEIQIRHENGPVGTFKARLDGSGEVVFFVSGSTPKGSYEFLGARLAGTPAWVRSDPPGRLVVK